MSVLDLIPAKKKKATRVQVSPPLVFSRYEAPAFPVTHPVPAGLARKLKSLGQRVLMVRWGERLAQGLTFAVMLLTLQMALDWLIEIPYLVRALILCGDVGLLVYCTRKYLRPLLRKPPTQKSCALLVEKHWPTLRGRVIATVELALPQLSHTAPELVYALQQETVARTVQLDFREIVPLRPLVRRAGAALVVTVLWLGLMVVLAPSSTALLERVFLFSAKVPRKTEVICLSGNKIVPVGDSVLLEAQAKGIVPAHGLATLKFDSGRIQEITMDPEPQHTDRFSLKIDKLDESLHYTIRLNDGVSDSYEVKIVPRPGITSVDCDQVYPPYAGLPDAQRMPGNLALLAGSKLKIHAVANSKITKAVIKLIGLPQTLPMTITQPEAKELTGEINIPATGLTAFSIEITNEAGVTSGDETQYPIDIIPDQPPAIDLTYPEETEKLCTLKAKPIIGFAATDDYGLAKVFLCYRVLQAQDAESEDSTAPNPALPSPKKIEMDLGNDRPLTLQRRFTLDFSTIIPPLTEGTTIEYWMEAQDANNVTGPGIGESDHHTLKVVSQVDFLADVRRRLMEDLSNGEDIMTDQQKANDLLGNEIQGKTDNQ